MAGLVPPREQWLKHLLPLPHEISFGGAVCCMPGELSIRVSDKAGPAERFALAELTDCIQRKSGHAPVGSRFEILLGMVDDRGMVDGLSIAEFDRFAALPNWDQAYVIQPQGAERLVLGGGGPQGVYYAVRTLIQLLEPVLGPEQVIVPLVSIMDWPDLAERGLWNFPEPAEWIPWLSSLKLNYGKMDTTLCPIVRGKQNHAEIEAELMMKSRLRAFNYVPYIVHLNFLHDVGLFTAYPELAGKGDGALAGRYFAHKSGNQHRAPCASNPLLVDILTEWMGDIADKGATEVSCWLTERPAQCGCEPCTAVGQFVLEARAFVAAWRKTQDRHPTFLIRLFLSTTTAQKDHQILAETPSEVKIVRACATMMERVLCEPRDLNANPLLDHYAARGRWLVSYDVPLTVNACVETPEFKLPESSAHRVRDYVHHLHRRNYQGAIGMMAWQTTVTRETCGFNISALAEWGWNVNGRSEREFAIAWATLRGHGDPERVGEWAELIGAVEFDVYDSDFPICYSWGQAEEMVKQRHRPHLGEGMFRYYADAEDFDRKLEVCNRAMRVAAGLANPLFVLETDVTKSYVSLAKHIYRVAELFATVDLAQPEQQVLILFALKDLEKSGEENVAAIRSWRSALGPEPWHFRVHDAVAATERTVKGICSHIRDHYLSVQTVSAVPTYTLEGVGTEKRSP